MKTPAFVFDSDVILRHLKDFATNDKSALLADRKTQQYYQYKAKHLLWVDLAGVDCRADSLLAWLHTVGEIGMSEKAFFVARLECDLNRLRTLDFDDDINLVAARLEYHLTKACMRYCYGQRYGFINPHRIFNNLDVEKEDSVRHIVRYRGLFDYDMETAPANYDSLLVGKIEDGSLAAYLHDIQPQGKLYDTLKDMLRQTVADSSEQRRRILCNMERCRWRLHHPIPETGKRVVVNIPAYHLYAFGEDSVLDMRVVCGALKTKTPQLTSEIAWMEVNPQWVIPTSILEKDVIRHIGDSAYFARNRYSIFERATNKEVAVGDFTRSMLLSGKYRVAQQSGSDNSLGRIVFRFKNKFQVFLHYTSTPSAFLRESRAISHGCVRVANPFELAQFVLDNPDEWLLDRMRISMDLAPRTDRGRNYLRTHAMEKEHKLIGYVPVKPAIPLYIIYYTIWPDEHQTLRIWPDVYGYDGVIYQHLLPYIS